MNTSEDSEAFYRGKPCNAFSLFGGGPSDYSRLRMTSSNVIKRALFIEWCSRLSRFASKITMLDYSVVENPRFYDHL